MASAADVERQFGIAKRFVSVYCREQHGGDGSPLCSECAELLAYARKRLERCPYDPKPKCKECRTHCYRPDYREKMKAVMRFSGIYHVKRGRLDWLFKYFLARRKEVSPRETVASVGSDD
jgi:hypothetical protein